MAVLGESEKSTRKIIEALDWFLSNQIAQEKYE